MSESPGRWPTDKGFEEWYGPPRTYDEALWPTDPWYDPQRDPQSRMVQIKKGEADVTEGAQLTRDVRRDCDTEYLERSSEFIRRRVAGGSPFFVYFNHSMMHMPVVPRAEFKGKTGHGDWADSLLELDSDFGVLLDLLAELEIGDNTLVVFLGDNGPEEVVLWRGSPGDWEGSYFADREGNLRPPASCVGQDTWPRTGSATTSRRSPTGSPRSSTMPASASRRIASATASTSATGSPEPGPPQRAMAASSGWARTSTASSGASSSWCWSSRNTRQTRSADSHRPGIINLVTDPQEREAIAIPYLHSSTAFHFNRILSEFTAGTQREPPIAASAPLEFVPAAAHRQAVARIADQRAAQPAWSHSRLAAGRGCRHAVSPERQLRRRDLRWRGPAAATHHDPEGRLPCGHESRPRR
jgi:hypothetical protein